MLCSNTHDTSHSYAQYKTYIEMRIYATERGHFYVAYRTHVPTRKISNLKLLHADENCSFVGFAKRSDDNKNT